MFGWPSSTGSCRRLPSADRAVTTKQDRVRRFFAELRRRKVIRFAIGYAIIGAGITEGASNIFGPLGLSEGAQKAIAVLVLAGFPVALVLSWVFDITLRGIERTPSAAPAALPREPLPADSIAIIPFENLSGDAAQSYLADGLTEELLVALSRVPGLRVAARTSCFAFRGARADVREIGERLRARHIVEGSTRLTGGRLRLSVRLIDAETGYALWTEAYEREIESIFDIQAEIAREIVGRLPRVGAATDQVVAGPGTNDVHAFQEYLQGRFHWNRRTESDLRRAIERFGSAVRRDPGYARAWAGMADAWSLLLDYGGVEPAKGLDPAREAAERALAASPDTAESWTSVALVRDFEWRWADADEAFRRAIKLQPDYPVARQRYALHLAWAGRHDEAAREADAAVELDPLSTAVSASAGFVLYYARRFNDAVARLDRTIIADPGFATARVALGVCLLGLGRAQEAVQSLRRAVDDSGRASSALALLGLAHARAGDEGATRAVIAELDERRKKKWVSGYQLALPHIGLGEYAAALDHLEQACDDRAPQMAYLGHDPALDPLRGDVRFTALLARVGLAA
jgi:serine/threonine-protein kinase